MNQLGAARAVISPLGQGKSGAVNWYLAGGAPAPVGAYQAKGVASYAASKVNLANPGTNDLTEGNGAVTWDATNGWQFVDTESKFLLTGITPGGTYTALCQFANVTSIGDTCLFGIAVTNANFSIRPARTSKVRYLFGNAAADISPAATTGNLGLVGDIGYRNGTADSTSIGTISGTPVAMILGAVTTNGTTAVAGSFITANILSFVIYDSILTGPQAAAVAAAMAAL